MFSHLFVFSNFDLQNSLSRLLRVEAGPIEAGDDFSRLFCGFLALYKLKSVRNAQFLRMNHGENTFIHT